MEIKPSEYEAIECSIKTGSILSVDLDGCLIVGSSTSKATTKTISIKGASSITSDRPREVQNRINVLFKENQDKSARKLQTHCYEVIIEDYCSKPISLGDAITATSEISKTLSNPRINKHFYFEWDDTKKELTAHSYEVSLWTKLGLRNSSKCFVPIAYGKNKVKGLLVKNQSQATQLLSHLKNSGNHEKIYDTLKQISTLNTELKASYKMATSFSSREELTNFLSAIQDKDDYYFEWNQQTKQLISHPYKPSIWTKLGFRPSTRFIPVSKDPAISIRMQNHTQMQALGLYLGQLDIDKKNEKEIAITNKFKDYPDKLKQSTEIANKICLELQEYKKNKDPFENYIELVRLLKSARNCIETSTTLIGLSGADYEELQKMNPDLHKEVLQKLHENAMKLAELRKLITLYLQTSPEIKIDTQHNDSIYTWNTQTHCLSNIPSKEKTSSIIPIIQRLKNLMNNNRFSKRLTKHLEALKINDNMGLHMSEETSKEFVKHLLSNGPFGLLKALETLKPYLIAEKPLAAPEPRKEEYDRDGFLSSSTPHDFIQDDSATSISSRSNSPTSTPSPSPTSINSETIQYDTAYPLDNNDKLFVKTLPKGLNKNQVFYELDIKKEKDSNATSYTLIPKQLKNGITENLKKYSSKVFVHFGDNDQCPGIFFENATKAEAFCNLIQRQKKYAPLLIKTLENLASPFNTIIQESDVNGSRYTKKRHLLSPTTPSSEDFASPLDTIPKESKLTTSKHNPPDYETQKVLNGTRIQFMKKPVDLFYNNVYHELKKIDHNTFALHPISLEKNTTERYFVNTSSTQKRGIVFKDKESAARFLKILKNNKMTEKEFNQQFEGYTFPLRDFQTANQAKNISEYKEALF